MALAKGYGMIAGRGRDKAVAALAAAESVGVSASEVRTDPDGYIVPIKVLDAYEAALKAATDDEAPAKAAPKKSAPKKKTDPSDESPSD